MNQILPQAEELLSTLKELMPTIYQQETLESIESLYFFKGKDILFLIIVLLNLKVPKRRFLNHYKWSTRSLIRTVRACILELILSSSAKR